VGNVHQATEHPGGATLVGRKQNGFFVARQTLPGDPVYGQDQSSLRGWDPAGQLIYQVPASGSWPAACFVTPTGQPITPPAPGHHCQTGVPWA
jgi:hypothetical protein